MEEKEIDVVMNVTVIAQNVSPPQNVQSLQHNLSSVFQAADQRRTSRASARQQAE